MRYCRVYNTDMTGKDSTAEAGRWLDMLLPLYRQATGYINLVADDVSDAGTPANLAALPEVIQRLSPIRKAVIELPRPKDRELRRLKKDFKLALDACIKAGKWDLKLEQKASRLRLAMTVFWTELAVSFSQSLAYKMAIMAPNYAGCGGDA
jgi:hypothetical protein